MQNSALLQTLNALTIAERRELAVFLEKKVYHTTKHGKQIVALFTLLDTHLTSASDKILEKKSVYAHISAGKVYRKGYLENLMTELQTAIRQFITEKTLRSRWGKVVEELCMAEFYRSRALPARAQNALQRAETELRSTDADETPLLRWWIDNEAFSQAAWMNQRSGNLNLPEALHSCLSYMAPELLRLTAAYNNQKRVFPDMDDHWGAFLSQIRLIFRQVEYFENPALQLLDQAITLMEAPETIGRAELDAFIQSFRASGLSASNRETRVIAAYIRNAFIRIIHQYQPDERMRFYREQLEAGWLYENGQIPAASFLNLVRVGIQSGNLAWLQTFLADHKNRIAGPQCENIQLLGQAQFHFAGNDWKAVEKCLNHLRQLPKLRDLSLEKLMRLLEIKTAYELRNHEHLNDLIKSFSIFLTRNKKKIGQHNYAMDRHFVQILRQLIRYGQVYRNKAAPKNKLPALSYTVQNPHNQIAERIWLCEKSTELVNSLS